MVFDYQYATSYSLDVQVSIFLHLWIFVSLLNICLSNHLFRRDILVRFASKNFTLNNFHESIHLCNTTVQLKYRKTINENSPIPCELHWNLHNFKEYLKYAFYITFKINLEQLFNGFIFSEPRIANQRGKSSLNRV